MSSKTGRNDLCPCGSGKKYKKCCLATENIAANIVAIADSKWRQLRQLEGNLIANCLYPYATQKLPAVLIKAARAEFLPREGLPKDLDEKMLFDCFFDPWFLFNWIPLNDFEIENFDADKTIAENYLDSHRHHLSDREVLFIETMSRSYYSFYCVLEVEVDQGMQVKDILLGTTHTVKERMGTRQISRGDLVYGRILTMEEQSIFIGMAPFIIPATYHLDLIDFRKYLIKENSGRKLSDKVLRNDFDLLTLDYFFLIMKKVFDSPMPTLMNTDNELVVFTESIFKLTITPEEAVTNLLPMALDVELEDLLEEAEKDKTGKIKKIQFSWMKKWNKKNKTWSNTILGEITIEKSRLILETNSRERAELGKNLLEKHLGNNVFFQKTSEESQEQRIKALSKDKSRQEPKLPESDEMQQAIEAMAKSYWKNWLNESIPALGNKTPRQSAKTKEGRERLEALLLEYERNDMDKDNNDPFRADIDYLRNELGI